MMTFDQLFNTCVQLTQGDKQYCKEILKTLVKLANERMVMYTDDHGIRHIVVLPDDDTPLVDVHGGEDKSLLVKLKGERYVSLIMYAYDGEFKPVRAVVSTLEYVSMLNSHAPFKEIIRDMLMRWEGHEQ